MCKPRFGNPIRIPIPSQKKMYEISNMSLFLTLNFYNRKSVPTRLLVTSDSHRTPTLYFSSNKTERSRGMTTGTRLFERAPLLYALLNSSNLLVSKVSFAYKSLFAYACLTI